MTEEFNKIGDLPTEDGRGICAPPCLWLRYAVSAMVMAVSVSVPVVWSRYRQFSDVQAAHESLLSGIHQRVAALEKGAEQNRIEVSRLVEEVAGLRGESRAVLRNTDRLVDELAKLRQEVKR